MKTDSFIKMGPQYVSWSSTVTKDEIELIEVFGKGVTRKVTSYKVVVKDLMDMLLFRCHGLRKILEVDLGGMSNEEVNGYYNHNTPTCVMDSYEVSIESNTYLVNFPLSELTKLLKINRRSSTWDNVKNSRSTLDVPTMVKVIEKMISISIIRFSTRANLSLRYKGAGAVVTKAYIDETENKVYFQLDKELVDLLTPDNQYNAKYLADSFVLASEYCKNLHSFVSYFADVFSCGNWGNGRLYNYTAIDTLAEAMGVRYSSALRDYCSKTKTYSRTSIVQFVKKYVAEINEKTRIPEQYGTLCYEVIYSTGGSRKQVCGIKFYFEEAE